MENPPFYAELNEDSLLDARNTLEFCKDMLKWDGRKTEYHVLDVGCGPGNVTATVLKQFLPEGTTIIGCDISQDAVKYANDKYASDTVAFEVLDISDSDIRSKRGVDIFDKIFSFYCLHRIEKQRVAAQNMFNLLKPGGQIFFVTPAKHPMFQLCDLISEMPKYMTFTKDKKNVPLTYLYEDPVQEEINLLSSVGFKVDKSFLKESSFEFDSVESFIKLFEIVNPFVHAMPPTLRQELPTDCKNIINTNEIFEVINEGIRSNYNLIVTIASKPWK